MKKTPQDFKREEISVIFEKTLGKDITRLKPLSINISESAEEAQSKSNISFLESGISKEIVCLENVQAKGLVDCLFTGIQEHYAPRYESLKKIRLFDFEVNPSWRTSTRNSATDAKASIILTMGMKNVKTSGFYHTSRSVVYSAFAASLSAFEFFINCERSFSKIQLILDDASKRNRFDIVDNWKFTLSKLTEVNNYVQERKN